MTDVMEELRFMSFLKSNDYSHVRPIGNGRYAAIAQFMFSTAIVVGRIGNYSCYEDRWCYKTAEDATLPWKHGMGKVSPRDGCVTRRREGGAPMAMPRPSTSTPSSAGYPLPFKRLNMAVPFVLDATALVKIANLVEYASDLDRESEQEFRNTIVLPYGWTVTYTIDELDNGAECRHLSMAAPLGEDLRIEIIQATMNAFGFLNSFELLESLGVVWYENVSDGRIAINVLEPLSGKITDLRDSPADWGTA